MTLGRTGHRRRRRTGWRSRPVEPVEPIRAVGAIRTVRTVKTAGAVGAVLVVGILGLAGCSGGNDDASGDPVAFCRAVEDLRNYDPFAELAFASPAEMRDAFDALANGAAPIVDTAPPAAATQADRYGTAVDTLIDLLRGGGYDLETIDVGAYQRAVDDYTDAARSLDNAADAACTPTD